MEKRMFTFVPLLILALSLAGCTIWPAEIPRDSHPIRIAYLPITHSLVPMMMADDYFEQEPFHIELVRFSTWPDVVEALRTGRVDGASILFEVALLAQQHGGFTLFRLSHRNGNVVVVGNDIVDYHDLIGRTVAIPHQRSPQNTLLQIILEREGISPTDIHIIDLSPPEMPFTMASGAIAAFIVAEPFGAVAEDVGIGRIMETSDDILPGAICCVMIFRDEFLEDFPEAQEWLKARFDTATGRAQTDDDAALTTLRRHSTTRDSALARSLHNTTFDDLLLTYDEYKRITELIVWHGVLEYIPSFDAFVAQDY